MLIVLSFVAALLLQLRVLNLKGESNLNNSPFVVQKVRAIVEEATFLYYCTAAGRLTKLNYPNWIITG